MIRSLLARVGCLLLFFGTIVLVVGLAAAQSGEPPLSLYLIGGAAGFSGFLLWIRMRDKRSKDKRFSLFRKRSRRETQKEDNDWENRFYD
jgi:hypothetical protein